MDELGTDVATEAKTSGPIDTDPFSDPSVSASPEESEDAAAGDTDVQDSILLSIKDALGILPGYTPFDNQIILHINSTFAVLHQLGVGPDEPFHISDSSAKWSDFDTIMNAQDVRTYMYLKVKVLFDSLSNSAMFTPYDNLIKEYEWRLRVAADDARLDSSLTI